jgi:hypothetical protein
MKSLSSKLSVLVTVAVVTGATFARVQDDSTLSQLANYRQWTKINSEPVKVETPVSVDALTSPAGSAPV